MKIDLKDEKQEVKENEKKEKVKDEDLEIKIVILQKLILNVS
jgi:hypothetical protein